MRSHKKPKETELKFRAGFVARCVNQHGGTLTWPGVKFLLPQKGYLLKRKKLRNLSGRIPMNRQPGISLMNLLLRENPFEAFSNGPF